MGNTSDELLREMFCMLLAILPHSELDNALERESQGWVYRHNVELTSTYYKFVAFTRMAHFTDADLKDFIEILGRMRNY